jgi:Uma2 family endonuclease
LVTEAAVDRWRWTVESYEQAAATGVFGPEPRVELIDGEVFEVPSMLPEHAATVGRLVDLLTERLDRRRWTVRSQLPVRLGDRSEPEPDVWVAQGPASRYDDRHPEASDLALVVEVSDTTLAFDRTIKVPRYAAAGVAEAWVVSLAENVVHQLADPDPAAAAYRVAEVVQRGSRVTGISLGIDLAVAAILPAR